MIHDSRYTIYEMSTMEYITCQNTPSMIVKMVNGGDSKKTVDILLLLI